MLLADERRALERLAGQRQSFCNECGMFGMYSLLRECESRKAVTASLQEKQPQSSLMHAAHQPRASRVSSRVRGSTAHLKPPEAAGMDAVGCASALPC